MLCLKTTNKIIYVDTMKRLITFGSIQESDSVALNCD